MSSPARGQVAGAYRLCYPDGIIEGEKYVVGEILGNAPEPCERGRPLKLVELRPI
ncbi:MAG: UPF0179 family protein [Methanoculleus sp.]